MQRYILRIYSSRSLNTNTFYCLVLLKLLFKTLLLKFQMKLFSQNMFIKWNYLPQPNYSIRCQNSVQYNCSCLCTVYFILWYANFTFLLMNRMYYLSYRWLQVIQLKKQLFIAECFSPPLVVSYKSCNTFSVKYNITTFFHAVYQSQPDFTIRSLYITRKEAAALHSGYTCFPFRHYNVQWLKFQIWDNTQIGKYILKSENWN
jgi:hypothetical protein